MARTLPNRLRGWDKPPGGAGDSERMKSFAGSRETAVLILLLFANSLFSYGQSDSIYRLPEGTRITVKLDLDLSSKVASANDTFLASVAKPVINRERVVMPEGTVIEGRVVEVERAGAGSKDGELEVVFETLRIAGQTRRIEGVPVSPIESRSSNLFSILSVLGGAVVGTAVGSASNASSGAAIGAAVGAGAGTGIALIKKGKEAKIRKGQEFEIELKREVTLPVLDY
jgi:hypothetical protein